MCSYKACPRTVTAPQCYKSASQINIEQSLYGTNAEGRLQFDLDFCAPKIFSSDRNTETTSLPNGNN
uniref:Uncharacterized protein n=1 Tax=Arundo donax TaxID=35708 RepID=A0A0A9EYY2_ARUDO